MIARRTRENTVTGLITEFLRNSGVYALGPVGLTVPGEWPQEPDFEIRNGGVFVGEAKWEKDYYKGIAEAHDYMRSPAINGAFAIAYPDELGAAIDQADLLGQSVQQILSGHRFRVAFLSRTAGTDLKSLEIGELADWIKGHIHQRIRPQPAPAEVITVLQQVAEALTRGIETVDAPDLFKNVLGVEPDEEEQEVAARRAAGFLLVNQITFYRVLSSVKDKYPDLDPYGIGDPTDFQTYFDRVLDDNYSAIFSFPVASFFSHPHLELLRGAVHSIYGLGPEQIDHEVLGTVFHALTPLSVRKPLGAFYTLHKAAEILAHLAVSETNARVLDPACGAGQLLTAAYERKRELLSSFSEVEHRRFLEEEITGIDIMPFAAHLSTIHLAMESPQYPTDHVRIGIEDSTTLRPGDSIAPLSYVLPESLRGQGELFSSSKEDEEGPLVQVGGISLKGVDQKPIDLESVDVVIMNPPFSRQESIAAFSKDYKGLLRERFQRLRKHQLHGKMNFSGYFLFLADRFLKPSGRVASVLPASVLVNASDSGVREMLLAEYKIRVLVAREDEPRFSEDTDHQEILLIADKGEPRTEDPVTIVTVTDLAEASADDIADADEKLRRRRESGDEGGGVTVSGSGFVARGLQMGDLHVHNMFAPLAVRNFELFMLWREVRENTNLTRIEDLATGLIRGGSSHPWQDGALSAPDSHVEASDSWIVESKSHTEVTIKHRHLKDTSLKVPRKSLRPYLLRYSHRNHMDITDLPEYTVVEKFPKYAKFLEFGDGDPMPDGWRDHVESAGAHVGLMRRCDLTASGTCLMSFYDEEPRTFHRMWCLPDVSASEGRIYVLWLNSSLGLLQFLLNRVPGRGGWTNYRKFLVEEFLVLDPSKLDTESSRKLENILSSVRHVDFPSLASQFIRLVKPAQLSEEEKQAVERVYPQESGKLGSGFAPRRDMDREIGDIIDLAPDIDSFLDQLYAQLLSELVSLKLMMQ